MKKALITGITGQDGSFLAEFLLEKGYEVHGITRRASISNTARIDHLLRAGSITLHDGDLSDSISLIKIIGEVQQMLCPHRRIAEAFCTGMGLDAGSLRQALRLRHQGDGLQHIKAADGTAGQMHLGAALHGGSFDLCVEIQIRKGTDG